MKVAIVHLSDFHIRDREVFLNQKVDGVLSALNVLGNIDDYVVVFSGDLSHSGQVNEFKKSRYLIGKIISGIKQKNGNKFVNLFMVPGNHDLCLPQNAREGKDIQEHYDNGTIEKILDAEASYLENYYLYSNAGGRVPYNLFLNKRSRDFGGYKIQFNLINTAFFSTLRPDDKELHYFPDNQISSLARNTDTNLCITVMHHNYEWFNWKCKSNLEKTIIDNSEFLLYGHDHRERATSLSVDKGLDTWISAAGEMKFSELDYVDSFNTIVIDTEDNSFDGYIFTWNQKSKIYVHEVVAAKKSLQNHSVKLMPLPSFIKGLKEDTYNMSKDFTEYFVFPKLTTEVHNNQEKDRSATTIEDFKRILFKHKKLFVSGAANAGKTTLLKYLYCSLTDEMTPLFLSAESKQKLKIHNFIRHLFEDQYGDDKVLFERYEQLGLEKKVTQSIMKVAKRGDVDELFTVFEELAGYMYNNKKDELQIEEVRSVVQCYNEMFGEKVNIRDVINVGVQSKILRETDDLSIYFTNKNHLSYFIAKYLIRLSQGEPSDTSGIEYALENICFGINADIVLFVSYILNNTKMLTSIKNYAGELLEPWEAVSFQDKNISLFHNIPVEQIDPPTDEEKKKYEVVKEKFEEKHYSEESIEARGLFDYDDSDIDQYHYGLIRAIKYTEMICKALPAFHSKLKLDQKNRLVESIYLYPRKIVFALLRPLDMDLDGKCKEILDFANRNNKMKKNGEAYTREDILAMLNDSARAIMLSVFDHFSELASSPKTWELLISKELNDMSEQLERLLIIESSGDTDRLVKESESLLKVKPGLEYDTMIRLIVRKHLLTNKSLTFNKKQQVIDKIFGEQHRKDFLVNKN